MIPVIGRKLKRGKQLYNRAKSGYDRVQELRELYQDIQEALDRARAPVREVQRQFQNPPPRTVQTVRQPSATRDWKKDAALVGVIALAAWTLARRPGGLSGRLSPAGAMFGAIGIIAPFLAGQTTEPRTLTMVPNYALNNFAMRRRQRKLEEQQGSGDDANLIFEDPPGGGAPSNGQHFMWFARSGDGVAFMVIHTLRGGAQGPAWLVTGTLSEIRAFWNQLTPRIQRGWINHIVSYDRDETRAEDWWGDGPNSLPIEAEDPGSELEEGNQETINESTPVGNIW